MPRPGEFQPVTINYEELKENGITGPYYVETNKWSVYVMSHIREFAKEHEVQINNFIQDWTADIDGINLKVQRSFDAKIAARNMLMKALPYIYGVNNLNLYFCGSTLNNCGLGNSDADICWAIPVVANNNIEYPMLNLGTTPTSQILYEAYWSVSNYRNSTEGEIVNVEFLDGARVQILKLKYFYYGTKTVVDVDLNINNVAGIYNTFLLRHYSKIDSRFTQLVKLLKMWGVNANVINSREKRINSYTMTLMVVHFLQSGVSPPILPNLVCMFPGLFDGKLSLDEMAKHYDDDLGIMMTPKNDSNLYELLIGFMYYYSHFDYKRKGILLREGRVIEKPQQYSKVQFYIEEIYDGLTVPKNLLNYMIEDIRLKFLDSYFSLISLNRTYHEFKKYQPYLYRNKNNRFIRRRRMHPG